MPSGNASIFPVNLKSARYCRNPSENSPCSQEFDILLRKIACSQCIRSTVPNPADTTNPTIIWILPVEHIEYNHLIFEPFFKISVGHCQLVIIHQHCQISHRINLSIKKLLHQSVWCNSLCFYYFVLVIKSTIDDIRSLWSVGNHRDWESDLLFDKLDILTTVLWKILILLNSADILLPSRKYLIYRFCFL